MQRLKPSSFFLALEPRVMFDGAAASAAEQHHVTGQPAHAGDTATAADRPAPTAAAMSADTAARAPTGAVLLVVDSRVEDRDALLANLPSTTHVLVVDAQTDGISAISKALADLGSADAVQILAHGAPGQFTLGTTTLSSTNIDRLGSSIQAWSSHLSAGADIELYGCDIGAGSAGVALVDGMAHWTGADVAASSDATGNAAQGGNWTLEVTDGHIEHALALNATSVASYDHLLADAAPTVSLSAASTDALLGGNVTFTASFSNASGQIGYAPYLDVFLPATGRDGDDGVSFVSATYLGQAIKSFTLTFDANGNAVHPLAKDASGNALVIHAADYGLRAGDQFVVLELPYADISADQPSVDIQITAHVSDLADTSFSNGSPDLTVLVRGGFELGNDSANNPTTDPSLVEAALHDLVIHPTVITVTEAFDIPEGKTATGPNYERSLTITATPAPGQSLSNIVVTQAIPEEMLVTGITPGGGGTLTSITLHDGSVLTAPVTIQAAFARGAFVDSFTVTYAVLSGPTDVVVQFYVPEADAEGNSVIDPTTAAPRDIVIAGATAAGAWQPLDPRDRTSDGSPVALSGTGAGSDFIVEAAALYKQVTLQTDIGTTGLSPGDTLSYTVDVQLSDYFALGRNVLGEGQFVIRDAVGDGQTLSGTPVLTYTVNGVTHTVDVVTVEVLNPDGSTTLAFDIAQSLLAAGEDIGAIAGDLAFDSVLQGATQMHITYLATVAQAYTTPYRQSEINEGDALSNDATLTATVLEDTVNLTGAVVTDHDAVTDTVPTSDVDITVVSVNGGPSATGEVDPGDTVTFRMSYDLTTGDYEQFRLTGYLPLPLFDVAGVTWTQGTGIGQWSYGAGNTNGDTTVTVTSGPGNSIIFDFGDYATAATVGSRIEVQFTVRVGDQAFADQRSLSVLGQSDQLTTIEGNHLISSDVALITSVAEPNVSIDHGVVSTTHGTVTGSTGTWTAPGSTGVPFDGPLTDPTAVSGSVTGIDAGDTVRLATALENTGGGDAYDVVTTVGLPTGLSFVGGSLGAANLQIFRGDGSALVFGTDYSVSGNVITFLDAGGIATLSAGRAGTANDLSGANVLVITYDVTVDPTIGASSTLGSTATLNHYASEEGGADFTPTDLSASTVEQVAAPAVQVVFGGGTLDDGDSSAPQTTGSDLVVGESMIYDIVVTLPEGTTGNLDIDSLVPPGMRLDTSFNGTGYEIITTTAGSSALAANFNGSVTLASLTGLSGTLGADGVDGRFVFSANSVAGDNVPGNNQFVIRVRLVASNTIDNQAGRVLETSAQLGYTDPDGDMVAGPAVDRSVNATAPLPDATLREPTLQISQSTNAIPTIGVDQGDTVTYAVTLTNGNAGSDFNAYDIQFSDTLPLGLENLTLIGVSYNGGATHGGSNAPDGGFVIMNGVLRNADGSDIDIPKGGSIVLRFSGQVTADAVNTTSIDNTASVQWTSLDGDDTGERTGVDGLLGSGVLNDYRSNATSMVPVARGVFLSRVGGLPDTIATDPTNGPSENVTVGEVIRYRAVSVIGEGTTADYSVSVTLQSGLEFVDDGTVRIAFVSNGGITTTVTALITGGTLQIIGDENSPVALPLATDLSNDVATGVMNRLQYDVTTDAQGITTVTFHFGTLTNSDSDADLEGVVVTFNARVTNQAGIVAGAALGVTATERAGTTILATSNTIFEQVVEPAFGGLDKHITGFDPDTAGTTGTADVSIGFTQTGSAAAYDVTLTDSFPGGANYVFAGITINGTTYTDAAALPAGVSVTVDPTAGVTVTFDRLDVGDTVVVAYHVDLPNHTVTPSSNATLTWSSLPETFTSYAGSAVGADGSVDGERTGSGVGPNTYLLSEGAGLGIISGTLWDDTLTPTLDATPDGTPLPGQTVTLTWAGADGDLATTTDNQVFTAVTDLNGQYVFGVLPAGVYRIDVPAGTITDATLGALRVRVDNDTTTPVGSVDVTLGEGGQAEADAGFVQQNDAPVNTLPGDQAGAEDVALPIAGISVYDVDAGAGTLDVVVSVLHGTLTFGSLPAGVVVSGNGTGSVTISGDLTDLNVALSSLVYLGNANYNGTDTLTVQTRDRGNTGDADGDGIPSELTDQLVDTDSLQIVLVAVNDDPVAVPDVDSALEAGGNDNSMPGTNPTGNVLSNDIDVDIATNGDVLRVSSAQAHGATTSVVPGPLTPTEIVGTYGSLFMLSDGSYQYVVDNDNAAVQALRVSGQVLTDQFDYTVVDLAGTTPSTTTLTITIHGANDTPVGQDDNGVATEAGGVLNGTAGSDGTGNVLDNDTDVDSVANGETKSVTGVRAAPENGVGPPTDVTAGTTSANGTSIAGLYGTLTIGSDGSWRYVVDNSNATVQRMVPGDTLTEVFSYRVTDAAGSDDIAQLNIVINGADDNPVASDDVGSAQAGSNDGTTAEAGASGDVVHVASRPGTVDQAGGNGVDTDVDRTDQTAGALTVTGIADGPETGPGVQSGVLAGTSAADGTALAGLYGTLHIGADGTYTYDVDSANATILGLAPGGTITDVFTYQITDTHGLTDRAQLTITIHGANDAPTAVNDTADAIEAGGVANATAGLDPVGNVLDNDSDPDPGDTIAVQGFAHGTTNSIPGGTLAGAYGTLTMAADGSYRYVVDNGNATVQALRTDADRLTDTFTYTITDAAGSIGTATLAVTIHGRDDTPIAVDDAAQATEAGGTDNATPGVDPTGNLLTNDTDVDATDVHTVTGARTGSEAGGGAFTAVQGPTIIAGRYGNLVVGTDGSYVYSVDNSLAIVQALRPGQSLQDVFTYQTSDLAGATDAAQVTITVNGAWDAPQAVDDLAYAVAANPGEQGRDPDGNVLPNDTDVDALDQLSVTGIRAGSETAGGALISVNAGTTMTDGTVIVGLHGSLHIGADGSYVYEVNSSDPVLQALGPAQVATDVFTYRVGDLGGLTDLAQLTIFVRGQNAAPHGVDDAGTALEAGGVANGTPGVDPGGNVLANDTDVENDALTVTAIRTGDTGGTGASGAIGGASLRGQYGDLTMAADGSWHYTLDNSLAAVQALRTAGQHLVDVFTYTVTDFWGASSDAQLVVTIDGQNDAPVAHDDNAVAVEAGGVSNHTPGTDPAGNVLDNDTDVDSAANGETRQVLSVVSFDGSTVQAGRTLAGRYGQLTLQADGSYVYTVDNDNPTVQALRTAGETLSEVFVYTMRDTAGASSTARLTVLVRGANDNPVAVDDHNLADDQVRAPQASGDVLINDTDVDSGDARSVVAVRTAAESAIGVAGSVGQGLAGRYGTLVLQADGTYVYTIDMTNPEVLAAAGLGKVLQDAFTYTVRDLGGAEDQATLLIDLDIAAPYIPPPQPPLAGPLGPHEDDSLSSILSRPGLPALDPAVFVGPAVETDAFFQTALNSDVEGSRLRLLFRRDGSPSLGEGLGGVGDQFVGEAVRHSQLLSEVDRARFLARHGRISLSADGRLPDPSLFAAPGFNRQLKEAARARQTLAR